MRWDAPALIKMGAVNLDAMTDQQERQDNEKAARGEVCFLPVYCLPIIKSFEIGRDWREFLHYRKMHLMWMQIAPFINGLSPFCDVQC